MNVPKTNEPLWYIAFAFKPVLDLANLLGADKIKFVNKVNVNYNTYNEYRADAFVEGANMIGAGQGLITLGIVSWGVTALAAIEALVLSKRNTNGIPYWVGGVLGVYVSLIFVWNGIQWIRTVNCVNNLTK